MRLNVGLRSQARLRLNQRQGGARPMTGSGFGRRRRGWITGIARWPRGNRRRARYGGSRCLALGSERSDANHRLTEARPGRARRGSGGRRGRGRSPGRRWRRDADHRAAKTILGLRWREADDGLTQRSDRLTAARAPGRLRGISRSAVRAQPHRAHYNPGRTPATKLVSSPRLQGLCPISPFSRKGQS